MSEALARTEVVETPLLRSPYQPTRPEVDRSSHERTDEGSTSNASAPCSTVTALLLACRREACAEESAAELLAALDGSGQQHEVIVVLPPGPAREARARQVREAAPGVRCVISSGGGLASSLRAGVAAAESELVLTWPASLVCTGASLGPLFARLGAADVIVGHRASTGRQHLLRRVVDFGYRCCVRSLFGLKLRSAGQVALYRSDVLAEVDLAEPRLPCQTELLVRLRDRGASFEEVALEIETRPPPETAASLTARSLRGLVDLLRFWWRWRSN